jgi:hypothetical protein
VRAARTTFRFQEREAKGKGIGSRRQNPFRDTSAANRAAQGGGSPARGQREWLQTHCYPPLNSNRLSEGRDTSLAHSSPRPRCKAPNSGTQIAQEFNRPRLRLGQSRLTIPNLAPQSPSQRRSAPTAIHHRSGTSFGFLPESMFTFTGIPTHVILG